jgi:vancomycin resistance protein VanJ
MTKWRRYAYWASLLAFASIVGFIFILLIGEFRRLTLIPMYVPRHPLLLGCFVGAGLAYYGKKRVAALLVAFSVLAIVVLFPVMGFNISAGHEIDRPIRVATYNVWFGHGGRPALVEEIAAMPFDIIVIQAAYGSLEEQLKTRLPDRHIRQDGELAIVSKFPFHDVIVPPAFPDGTPSMYVKYVVDTPNGALRVFNLHAWSPRHALGGADDAHENIGAREAQVHGAVEAARSDVPPFIIAGDTNLPALSAIKRRNFGSLNDAFDEAGSGFGYTFPANHPWMRIDRILGSDGVHFASVRVGERGVSDHRSLSADMEIGGQ